MTLPSSSQLATNVTGKFSIEFSKVADQATACYIAVGMITDRMFEFALRKMVWCKDLRVITGVHMATTPAVLRKMQERTIAGNMWSGAYVDHYFHPKLYLFKTSLGWTAFVGSGNFTEGGWSGNEELFLKVTDTELCDQLLERFAKYEEACKPISDELIDWYTQSYTANQQLDHQKRRNIDNLLDRLNSNFNIDLVNFAGQFFSKEDHLAFQPGKTHLDTKEVHDERRKTRNKLYTLNDMLEKVIPASWRIHPHYDESHIASHIETMHHHDENVRSLWVGYGRDKNQLKQYGKYVSSNNTPLFYMRMQVIVSFNEVGVWLMPGKSGAGEIDRENLQRKLDDDNFSEEFFELVTGLGSSYWIEVADDHRDVAEFTNSNELRDYVRNDNWRKFYFIIGRNYSLGTPELKRENIAKTCLDNFAKYWPIYELIRDKSFS